MIWVELLVQKQIRGTLRDPGYRFQFPPTAARALISNGEARRVSGLYENGGRYPPSDSEEQEEKKEEEPTLGSFDFTEIDGVGERTAERIAEQVQPDELSKLPISELSVEQLTELPGIGEQTAEAIKEVVE